MCWRKRSIGNGSYEAIYGRIWDQPSANKRKSKRKQHRALRTRKSRTSRSKNSSRRLSLTLSIKEYHDYSGTGESPEIGVLGGTFDPIHRGHIYVADVVKGGLDWTEFIWSRLRALHTSPTTWPAPNCAMPWWRRPVGDSEDGVTAPTWSLAPGAGP